jgi:hypothetical protein
MMKVEAKLWRPTHREHSNIPLALASEGAPSAKFRTRKSYELRVLRGKPDLQRPTLNLQRATQVKAVYYSPLAAVLPVANCQSPFADVSARQEPRPPNPSTQQSV